MFSNHVCKVHFIQLRWVFTFTNGYNFFFLAAKSLHAEAKSWLAGKGFLALKMNGISISGCHRPEFKVYQTYYTSYATYTSV